MSGTPSLGELTRAGFYASSEIVLTPWSDVPAQEKHRWQEAGEAAAATAHEWYEKQWRNNSKGVA